MNIKEWRDLIVKNVEYELCDKCEQAMADAGVLGLTLDEMIEQGAQFDFGTALTFLKEGEKVARKGWNGKGQFVFLVKGVDLVKSVKGKHLGCIVVDALAIKTTSNQIQIGWFASQTDMLAEDWILLK